MPSKHRKSRAKPLNPVEREFDPKYAGKLTAHYLTRALEAAGITLNEAMRDEVGEIGVAFRTISRRLDRLERA